MSKVIGLLLFVFVVFGDIIYAFPQNPITPAPTPCKANEVYLPQGVAPNCDTVCSTLGEDCTVNYIQAPFGCYCANGFARNDANNCIPISKCPPKNPCKKRC